MNRRGGIRRKSFREIECRLRQMFDLELGRWMAWEREGEKYSGNTWRLLIARQNLAELKS